MPVTPKSSGMSVPSPARSQHSRRSFTGISDLFDSTKEDHFQRLGQYAARLWRSKAMTDVVIVVQEQEFRAHKAVLACYSPYLSEALVRPGFSDVHCLQLPSVTARSFAILLNYMYTSELKVSCRELCDVYRAARKLGIQGALKKCIELLYVTPNRLENMIYLYVTARKMDMADTAVRAFRLMVLHFEKVMVSEEFLDLEKEHIIELISSDELGTRGEVVVFLAALKWLNHKFLDREEHAFEVLDNIRFALMTLDEIITCYHPPIIPGIMEIPKIRHKLLSANCYITAKSIGRETLFPELAPKPRNFLITGEPMKLWETIQFEPGMTYFFKRIRAVVTIQAFFRGYRARKMVQQETADNTRAAAIIQAVFRGHMVRRAVNIMKEKARARKESSSFTTMVVSEAIKSPEIVDRIKPYYTSGIEEAARTESQWLTGIENIAQQILEKTEVSKALPNVPSEIVYVMGSYDARNKQINNPIFKFQTKDLTWEVTTRTDTPIHESRIVTNEKYLYVIGGSNQDHNIAYDDKLPLRECYMYEFSSKSWLPMSSMSFGRTYHSVVEYKTSILAIGGRNEFSKILSSIEEYSPRSKSWSPFGRDLPEPRMCMGAAVQDDQLWIAGGFTSVGSVVAVTDTVWSFSSKTNKWSERTKLPIPLGFVTLLADRQKLYCLGGAIRRQNDNGNISFESVDTVYLYKDDEWELQKPMPKQCHSVIATLTGGNIYVFGGYKTQTMSQLKELFYFDSGTGEWTGMGWIPYECSSHMLAAAEK